VSYLSVAFKITLFCSVISKHNVSSVISSPTEPRDAHLRDSDVDMTGSISQLLEM
jgi:hypothetical protein